MPDNFIPLACCILAVSDSRGLADDRSGDVLAECVQAASHRVVARERVKDDQALIAAQVRAWLAELKPDVVLATGGTGLTGRDVTPEAFEALYDKPIPGFGELFRWLSYEKIGPAAMLSRASGGLAQGTLLFALPGSPSACRDAWDMLLRHQLDNRSRPCNLASLMPRFCET